MLFQPGYTHKLSAHTKYHFGCGTVANRTQFKPTAHTLDKQSLNRLAELLT